MNRNIVLALVASCLFCGGFEAAAWNNSEQVSVSEKDEGFQARVIEFLLDRLVGYMDARLPLPLGDCVLTEVSFDSESVVSLSKVVSEDIYLTLNIEEVKSNMLYSFLKFPQQSTPLILLCIESDRNMIYRYYDKSKERHKDVNITVEELKELLGINEVDNERRKTAFSNCFSISDAPFTVSDDYCVLTTKLDLRLADVPDEYKTSEDDFRNMLLDGIRTKADNSLFTAIALYLRLGLKEIFIDEVGDKMVLSEPYSSMVDIFNKAQETQDVGDVPPVPVAVSEGETIIIDEDGDEPIPLQLVETKPLFEGKDFSTFSKWVADRTVYPAVAKAKGISGRVILSVTVGKDGVVKTVKILRSPDPTLGKEAARVAGMSPRWTPGYQNGKAVNVSVTVPVEFTLSR